MAKRAYGTGSIRVKHGAWYGSWRTPDGKRTTRKLGPVRRGQEGLSKKRAEGVLREMILTEAQRPKAQDDDLTVSQLGRLLLARLEQDGRKRSHVESVRYHLRTHIDPLLGDLPAHQVIGDDVRRLVDRMLRAGRAPKTIRNVAGTLHAVLGQVLTDNPVQMSQLPRVYKSKAIRFLTTAELERVIAAAPAPDAERAERVWWPVVRLLVLTAAMTGLRLGELRGLRWEDLDMAAMKVRVRVSFVRGRMDTPKSEDSSRAVPLASRLIDELDAHHRATVWNQDSDLVLAHPHTGRPLDRVRLLTYFKAALTRAEVRPVRIHDLRHTFATTIAASGDVSLRTLQEWMGHEDIRTTQIYAGYMPSGRDQELLDSAFERATDSNRTPIDAPPPPTSAGPDPAVTG